MPSGQNILAGREILDGKSALLIGDGEEGLLHYENERPHPPVVIAAQFDGAFPLTETLQAVGCARWLSNVEGPVLLRERAYVMDDGITVAHGEVLTDEQPLNARAEHGPLLVEQGRFFRCRVGFAGGQAFSDVYEYVLDFALALTSFTSSRG